jgi:SAM-dependent methyltransferase
MDVLELGPGTGPNFRYYPPSIRWTGIEPNTYLHAALTARGRVATDTAAIPTSTIDAVVCTLVLCSVQDPAEVLAETYRTLKPGGKFYFLEHVAAPEHSKLRRTQKFIQKPWSCIADGCDVCRDTLRLIEAAGFRQVDVERFTVTAGPASPHISGIAIK